MRSHLHSARTALLTTAVAALANLPAAAQCATQLEPNGAFAGTNGPVLCFHRWDPDAAGPLPAIPVAGGRFTVAGTALVANLATLDPATGAWSDFGGGVDGWSVNAMATLHDGSLVVAGSFAAAGGVPTANIARWDGTTWSPLGSGIAGGVGALGVLPNGDLVAGGSFATAGGQPATHLARWDGAAWSSMGAFDGFVSRIVVRPNGELVVGGAFTSPGNRIASWNGTTWSPLGGGLTFHLGALTTLPTGEVVAGGGIPAGPVASTGYVARWNGAAWVAMGPSLDGTVHALAIDANGQLVAGGVFTGHCARWNGVAWTPAAGQLLSSSTPAIVRELGPLPGGDVLVGGEFTVAGGVVGENVASWSGNTLSAVGMSAGLDDLVLDLQPLPDGGLIAGGFLRLADGVPTNRVARWNGIGWSSVGAPAGASNGFVKAVALQPNGDIVAGGDFSMIGGVGAPWAARWDGAQWNALPGLDQPVLALATLTSGEIVAGGVFTHGAARLVGGAWQPLGLPFGTKVECMAPLPDGGLLVGTVPAPNSSSVRRWHGGSWSIVAGAVTGSVLALAAMPNGDVVIGGLFTAVDGVPATNIARRSGTTWTALGGSASRLVQDVVVLPNGDLVAGGGWTNSQSGWLERWNGSAWTSIAPTNGLVQTLALTANGELAVGGAFTTFGNTLSRRFARFTPTCPATAIVHGAGCAGSGGVNTLSATALPWTGSTFRAAATGLPAVGIALGVTGFGTTTIALPTLLPQGVPGCDVLVAPDVVDVLPINGPELVTQLALPNAPALAGIVLHHQVVPFDWPAGGLQAVTSTNALTLTIGSL